MEQQMFVDPDAVRGVAAALSESADAVASAAEVMGSCGFGSATAGRSYGDLGDRWAMGYGRVGGAVRDWSAAGSDMADAVGSAARSYDDVDRAGSAELRRVDGVGR